MVENRGCEVVILGLIILTLLVLAVVIVVPNAIAGITDSHAEKLRAEAYLEQAKTDHDRARSEEWRREVQLYGVTLAAFLGTSPAWSIILAAVCGVLAAVIAIIALSRWKPML